MPQMLDERFARSVVYICAHSGEAGAMGLVINKPLGSLTMGELFAQLDIPPSGTAGSRPVHYGGPVEAGRGFVLHTTDYNEARSARDGVRVGACLPSAMPAGPRVSSMPRSKPMAGSRSQPTTRSFSILTTT
jgi:putative AlgH/UPF0301 family transcriptional regulator